jgi:hydrogenase large subunit
MSTKIIINPVTRISGFLEIEAKVEQNKIIDAQSSGMLFRGFEKMLQGRSPLDAIYFTERICGICSTAHSMSSAFALENALNIIPGENDKMIRDFIHGCEFVQNHIRHFFQYTLPDFVKGPDIHPVYTVSHNDFRLPESINRKLSSDYITSIQYGRLAHEMLAELGGKAPHNHGVFVGGVTVNIDVSKWLKVKSIHDQILQFVSNIMLEDIYILAKYYPEYYENGVGYKNLMTYGCYHTYSDPALTYVAPKVMINGEMHPFNDKVITENIYYAWYETEKIENKPTEENVIEPARSKELAYSWIKAPRYEGFPMEVGPLARMYLSNLYTRGISTMDRIIARVLETKKILEIMGKLLEKIQLQPAQQKQYEIPPNALGIGLTDTTRGSLGHWLAIQEQKIDHYEIITPTAWNLSPKDSKGIHGPIEKALIGTEIQDLENPVEIGRIVRSFDPCVSCATHVTGGFPTVKMRIV